MDLRILVFNKCNAQKPGEIVDPKTGKIPNEFCGMPVYGIAPGIVQNALCKEHFEELTKLTGGTVYNDKPVLSV